MGQGSKSVIGIAFQSAYGSEALVSSMDFFEFMSESITENIGTLKAGGMRGVFDEGESERGPITIEGDINIESRAIDVGLMLKAIFGDPTTTKADSAAVYSHVFEPRQSDYSDLSAGDPMTVYKYLDDQGSASMFSDMVANTFELSLANGDFLKTKLGVVGGSATQQAASAASYNTGKRFKWDQTSLSVDSISNCDFRDLTITVDESLEAQHTLCASPYPSRVKRTDFRSISIGGTLVFRNRTELEAYRAGSERPMVATVTGGVAISSGYYDSMEVNLPALRYTEADASAGGAGALELAVSGDAKYDVTSATGLRVTLVNTRAAY